MDMVIDVKKFSNNDEAFKCSNCGKEVQALEYSSRDHCPYCLYSRHVDINPGDRKNTCRGMMKPIGIEKYKDTYKIIYKCDKCHTIHKNIMAKDDDMNLIINLSTNGLI